jgi:hypothetical protein
MACAGTEGNLQRLSSFETFFLKTLPIPPNR